MVASVGFRAKLVVDQGINRAVIPVGDQDSDAGRIRGIGVVLSNHESETLTYQNEESHLVLRLEKKRGRWRGEPHLRYRFVTVDEEPKKPKPR